jgi:hypothetical protein
MAHQAAQEQQRSGTGTVYRVLVAIGQTDTTRKRILKAVHLEIHSAGNAFGREPGFGRI